MSIGPLEIAIIVTVIFLILGPRGIKKMANRGGKRLKATGDAALEAGSGAKDAFVAEPTGEGRAAAMGRKTRGAGDVALEKAREAGDVALEAGKDFRAGLEGRHEGDDADAPPPPPADRTST